MKPALFLVSLCIVLVVSCSRRPADFEAALFLFERNQLDQALPILEDLASRDPVEPRVLAYLAETYRRFDKKAEAVETARQALALDPCNSFAHTVIAEASNPLTGEWDGANSDTTWYHLMRAGECDPRDGNPWLTIWGESIRRGDWDMLARAEEKMMETGFFSRALLSYNEWVLSSLPENALLITNGDMDTYPVPALQAVQELRPDVVVVNRGMLTQQWYARYLRDKKGIPLPFSDEELDELASRTGDDGSIETPADDFISGWIEMWKQGRIRNPIAFAMTVPEDYARRFGEPLEYAGASRLVTHDPDAGPRVALMQQGLEGFTAEDFLGPWVTEQDRSPVRRVGTKNIVRNVTYAAIRLTIAFKDAGEPAEASRWLTLAAAIDNGSVLGPVYRERIGELKEELNTR